METMKTFGTVVPLTLQVFWMDRPAAAAFSGFPGPCCPEAVSVSIVSTVELSSALLWIVEAVVNATPRRTVVNFVTRMVIKAEAQQSSLFKVLGQSEEVW